MESASGSEITAALLDVGEAGDLLAQRLRDRLLRAQADGVGLDADAAQGGHAVLGRLGLELLADRDVRHQGDVDVEDVLAAQVVLELADRLQEGQRLDVADGAADLDDDHVGVALPGHPGDPLLDLVGDVGDDLDGGAEVVAAPLLGDDLAVDLAGGDVAEPSTGWRR